MNSDDPANIIENCLRQEKACYQELAAKLEEQVAVIQLEDEARLKTLIEEKRGLLASAQEVERQMETIVLALNPEELGRVARANEGLRQQVEDILQNIVKMENHCQVELKARKFLVKDQLLDIKKGKTMLKGYANEKQVKSRISKNV